MTRCGPFLPDLFWDDPALAQRKLLREKLFTDSSAKTMVSPCSPQRAVTPSTAHQPCLQQKGCSAPAHTSPTAHPRSEAGCRASPASCRSGLSLLLPSLPSLPRLPWSRPALTVALWALRVPQRLQPARPPHQHQGRDQPQSKPHVRARPPPALRARSFASARGSPALRPPCRARRPPGPAPGSAAAARGALWGGRGRHLGRGAVRRGGALMEAVWKGSQWGVWSSLAASVWSS